MNKIYKTLLAAAVVVPALTLTGCIEETFPESSTVTKTMVDEVPGSTENYALGMPAYMKNVFTVPNEFHWDYGYPSLMYIRDAMTGDMPTVASGYDHYSYWREDKLMGPEYIFSQFHWWYYYKLIQTANLTLEAIDKNTEDTHEKQLMGYAYAFRALAYLDLARMFEYLPCDATSPITDGGNDVTRYTVPIVTEDIDEEKARNNPRVTHDAMFEFILGDLDNAEKLITNEARTSKTMPDLACVYGLKARLYMWDGGDGDTRNLASYGKAAEYARKAISTSGATPLTPDEWTSTTDGFNNMNVSSWMWGIQYVEEDDAVRTRIVNPTSWFSNEYVEGYAAAGPQVMISKSLYDIMPDDDCRKLCFVAPAGSPLSGKEKFINRAGMVSSVGPIEINTYMSLKFRPGKGEMQDYLTACTVGIPVMRVEEMIFIEAEAISYSNPGQGAQLINNFMQQYRCPSFKVLGSTTDQVVDEIFNQKRIEFFLEGQTFFDIKRLNKSVTRNYTGTNFYKSCAFNTKGRPAWMNFAIVNQERDGNYALIGWNNPDPSDVYKDKKKKEESSEE